GTKAAALSGITTVFNMPNTKPPAITTNQVKKWMNKAKNNIYINVGFISGVPRNIDQEEIKNIIDLGVIGFKIYPLHSLNGIDWTKNENIQKILSISLKYQVPIFIHPDWPILEEHKEVIMKNHYNEKNILYLHDKLFPGKNELKYIEFMVENYEKFVKEDKLTKNYPILHFCHVSDKKSYIFLRDLVMKKENNFKITFEITPHHLLLSRDVKLMNSNYGKVLPPLRAPNHSSYLYKELIKDNVNLIGTDHAPHTLEEKNQKYLNAPSGFPGFETYTRILLNKVLEKEITLQTFVKISSENPAKIFGLKKKGFIEEGNDADLVIFDNVSPYEINSNDFISKAKFSPFEGYRSSVQIWKTFLGGVEINLYDEKPRGKIIKRE
ncbi:MAG: amidohydrolase family protein, partial [Promethearchaeota archaeon]